LSKLLSLSDLLPQTVDGLLFSAPLIPPVLDGRKDVTRRMSRKWLKRKKGDLIFVRETWRTSAAFDGVKPTELLERCKRAGYDQPWAPIRFEADHERRCWEGEFERHAPGVKRSSLLLPRLLARCVLRLTEDPRLERAQDITHLEAVAEGFDWAAPHAFTAKQGRAFEDDREDPREVGYEPLPTREHGFARDNFIRAWMALHTKDGERWEDNPLVVRIAFERAA
jgi:hypothetical protein